MFLTEAKEREHLTPVFLLNSIMFASADCWAKTDFQGQPSISVAEHCFFVGAVAEVLKNGLPDAARGLFPSGGEALIAAHDIGKITPGFLMKCPSWRVQWQSVLGLDAPDIYEGNHAKTGQKFLAEFLGEATFFL